MVDKPAQRRRAAISSLEILRKNFFRNFYENDRNGLPAGIDRTEFRHG